MHSERVAAFAEALPVTPKAIGAIFVAKTFSAPHHPRPFSVEGALEITPKFANAPCNLSAASQYLA
jgi:hypothetical protein